MTESRYLHFAYYGTKGKTHVWQVANKQSGDVLGLVSWYGPWRQYCFDPHEGTVYSAECLRDIATFCQERMNEHRGAKGSF